MTAGVYDIVILQGADFSLSLVWKDSSGNVIDITGYDARMDIRETKESDTIIKTLSVTGGEITITGASGQIDLALTAAVTDAFDFDDAVYDLEIISASGTVTRLMEGEVSLNREVTRST